jgi:hypothetical protein
MKKISLVILFLIYLALNGCAAPPPYTPAQNVIYIPPIGVAYEAGIGETIASKANLQVYPAILLKNEVSEKIDSILDKNQYYSIPPGTLVKVAEDNKGSYYKSSGGYYRYGEQGALGAQTSGVGLFVPNDNPSVALPVGMWGDVPFRIGKSIVKYEKTNGVERFTTGSFKKELLYSGLSQKTITFTYREFFDSAARPSFTLDVRYDLNDGNQIGYKGARFEIIKATNQKIQYKMISPID